MLKLLVLEDDYRLREIIAKNLEKTVMKYFRPKTGK